MTYEEINKTFTGCYPQTYPILSIIGANSFVQMY